MTDWQLARRRTVLTAPADGGGDRYGNRIQSHGLRGGYGEGSGGRRYDFAEGDADPYDDGIAGSHGTHVAGIIASRDSSCLGVASGVDLVSLRVFDDSGKGSFQWVEEALQWVHAHLNAFANPITTVNLSFGTTWNGETGPDWSIIEDELALLEADGVFIAVAAGNSFSTMGGRSDLPASAVMSCSHVGRQTMAR